MSGIKTGVRRIKWADGVPVLPCAGDSAVALPDGWWLLILTDPRPEAGR